MDQVLSVFTIKSSSDREAGRYFFILKYLSKNKSFGRRQYSAVGLHHPWRSELL